jgi:hypothetical protein
MIIGGSMAESKTFSIGGVTLKVESLRETMTLLAAKDGPDIQTSQNVLDVVAREVTRRIGMGARPQGNALVFMPHLEKGLAKTGNYQFICSVCEELAKKIPDGATLATYLEAEAKTAHAGKMIDEAITSEQAKSRTEALLMEKVKPQLTAVVLALVESGIAEDKIPVQRLADALMNVERNRIAGQSQGWGGPEL